MPENEDFPMTERFIMELEAHGSESILEYMADDPDFGLVRIRPGVFCTTADPVKQAELLRMHQDFVEQFTGNKPDPGE